MRYQVRGRRVPIPKVSTKTMQTQPIDYTKGWFNGVPNDLQPKKTLRDVIDMRFAGVGKYETRKGCDHYSVAVGEAINVQVTSTTGAADAGFSTSTWIAEKVTATADGVMTKIDVRIKNSASAFGTPLIEFYSDNSGVPGDLLAQSSIDEADIASTYGYETTYHIATPSVVNATAYWVVVHLQEEGTGTMYVSSTTNSTNAKTSTDGGQTWSPAAYSLNVKVYTADAGGVKGLTRIYRPDGTGKTFFAHGEDIYEVSDVDGSITSVDSGIDANSTHVRFDYVNDVLYYIDGVGKPRKYNFSAASEVSASPYSTSNIMEHVGILFYFDKDDRTRAFYTNFADYETFTSTDFIYVPAPKKSDYLTAMAKLNGVLYMFTRKNKHMLMGQDNATFRLDEAYAQKGTFSQESVVFDENYVYFASDDGIYRFNGTYEKNIAEGIIDDYIGLLDKDAINLQLHNNRLYIWYTPNGEATPSECFVYNTLYEVWESLDMSAHIGRSFARHDNTDLFLQAATNAGVIYYSERSTNDYNNLGAQLFAETRTAYDHFGDTQQKKRITYWRPNIDNVAGNYSMQAGYDADYADDPNFTNIALQVSGYAYDDPASLYDAITYASEGSSVDTTLTIPGDAYRWQRRYKHHAAREPFYFSGEVLIVQTRRLR